MKLPADTGPSLDRDRISTTSNADVRFWHLAGHASLHRTCPLLGVKRTCAFALQMSAYDP